MNTWNRYFSAVSMIVVACCLLLQTSSVKGQGRLSQYVVSTPPTVYSDISGKGGGGTLIASNLYGHNGLGYGTSFTTGAALPFDFSYDNQTIPAGRTFYFASGCVGLGQSFAYPYGYVLESSSYPNQICFANSQGGMAWGDNNYPGSIYQKTTGVSPNQVYTLQITNYHARCGGGGPNRGGSSYAGSVQIVFYQATGVIDLLYSVHNNYMSPCGTYYSGAVGLNGSTSPSFDYLTLEKQTGNFPTRDWRLTPPAPPANFSMQPASLNYPGTPVGGTASLTTRLTCLGPSALIINSTTLTGAPTFKVEKAVVSTGTTYTYPSTLPINYSLPAGQYIDFTISFNPATDGSLNGRFDVVTNAKDSATRTIVLNGSGLAPRVQYTFLPYQGIQYPDNSLFHHVALRIGDTLTEYFLVKNTGSAPLLFNSVYTIGLQSSMYTITKPPRSVLAAGAMDTIGVRFQPFLEGRPDAKLVISTNAFNLPNDTVSLWGTGKLGHLVITPQGGTTVGATQNGVLSFDSVAMGDSACKTMTLHNTGTDTVYIKRQIVTYGDYDFSFYPLVSSDTLLAPDASKLVNVCFVPVKQGARFASIRFYTSIPKTYPDNVDTSQFLIRVSGVGVPFGKLAVSGQLNDSAIVSTTKCITDTIRNTGSADLTVSSVKLTGAGATDFAVTLAGTPAPTLPLLIPAGGMQVVNLCYSPTQRGLSNATLTVTGTTSGRVQTQALTILGVGQVLCGDATPNPVVFGQAALNNMTLVDSTDQSCVTVQNCGDVTMTFNAAVTGAGYALSGSNSITLGAGQNGQICVNFAPKTIGTATGSITLTPDSTSVTPTVLPLNGLGAGVIVAGSNTPQNVMLGVCDTFDVTIQNTGNIPWMASTASITGGNSQFTAVGAVTPNPIPAGGSAVQKIAFCPTATGNATANLDFSGSTPNPISGLPIAVNASGGGSSVAQRTEQDGFAIGASYPNPTANSANVIVTLPRESKVTLTLVSVDGSQVASVYSGSLSQGQHVMTADVRSLASGTYFYMLESGSVRLMRELIVTK